VPTTLLASGSPPSRGGGRPKPLIRDQSTAVAVGVLLFLAGSFCLYDAFERRGGATPRVLRPFTWW
jgi:hypothetical protein